MKEIKLQSATLENSEFAYQTKKMAFKEYVDKVWGWDEDEQRKLHENRFSSQDFQIIKHGDDHVGIIAVMRDSESVKVNQMFILPEHQGKGIGTVCLNLILGEAKQLNLPIRLRVLKVNTRAQDFYARMGFTVSDEIETHVLMEKRL
jgi:GNAT superfamily N-acetyltransferase